MTSKQRSYLKSLASTLNPVFQIGKASLTPEVTVAIEECFNTKTVWMIPKRSHRLSLSVHTLR